ncbi:hypothetical protein ILYODFUR_017218 [Ilyodon furcidens]|uniref:Uncharacterized protein n=1 Tax=Ilyodon furcidens TaxID=33524 RepID=A0ABV0SMS4_9TELE
MLRFYERSSWDSIFISSKFSKMPKLVFLKSPTTGERRKTESCGMLLALLLLQPALNTNWNAVKAWGLWWPAKQSLHHDCITVTQ